MAWKPFPERLIIFMKNYSLLGKYFLFFHWFCWGRARHCGFVCLQITNHLSSRNKLFLPGLDHGGKKLKCCSVWEDCLHVQIVVSKLRSQVAMDHDRRHFKAAKVHQIISSKQHWTLNLGSHCNNSIIRVQLLPHSCWTWQRRIGESSFLLPVGQIHSHQEPVYCYNAIFYSLDE